MAPERPSAAARRGAQFLLALVIPCLVGPRLPTARADLYTLTDLGEFESGPPGTAATGGQGSLAFGLGAGGTVVGQATDALGRVRAFRWTGGGGFQELYPSAPDGLSQATGVNDSGDVVGQSNTGGFLTATLWPAGGGEIALPSFGGARSAAAGINAAGLIVGYGQIDSTRGVPGQDRAFRWSVSSGLVDLGTLPGGMESRALDVNSAGVAVGYSSTATSGRHAARWSAAGVISDLGTLGGQDSEARAINDAGDIVGLSTTADELARAFWKPASGPMVELNPLPGGETSQANDINVLGRVVGWSSTHSGAPHHGLNHAVIWISGLETDLNTLVTAPGWVLLDATAINDIGQIVGHGLNPDGAIHAFLLTPATSGAAARPPQPVIGLRAFPNPSSGSVTFQVSSSLPLRRVRLELFDIQGRMVERGNLGELPAGESLLSGGGLVPDLLRRTAGVYFLRLIHAGGATAPQRLVIVN